MSDPIVSPVTAEDRIFEDLGPAPKQPLPDAKEARIDFEERRRERERNDLMAVLNLDAGQSLVFRILAFCNVYSTTADKPIHEGRRQVGLWLIEALTRADPELYPQLLLKHLKRQRDLAAREAAIEETARRNQPPPGPFDRLARMVGLNK